MKAAATQLVLRGCKMPPFEVNANQEHVWIKVNYSVCIGHETCALVSVCGAHHYVENQL